MIVELRIRDLGVIDSLSLIFVDGMIALTGETGGGKTLVVTAIDLLVGGRADADLVRQGAESAEVEGRFVVTDAAGVERERVVRRVIPAVGRSRAYIDGQLASVSQLTELGSQTVDLHGQHAHQSLLGRIAQRRALDRYSSVDLTALEGARRRVADLVGQRDLLGGDARARRREMDLLLFQISELESAAFSAGEDVELRRSEERLGSASDARRAAIEGRELVQADGGLVDAVGELLARLASCSVFEAVAVRVQDFQEEAVEIGRELRILSESIEEDPQELARIRSRLDLLGSFQQKYGDTLEEILNYQDEVAGRLGELVKQEQRASTIDSELGEAQSQLLHESAAVAVVRRAGAERMGREIGDHLPSLALAGGVLTVEVGGADPCDEVEFNFSGNEGVAARPLRKVASGGELARVMLALRLVTSSGPPTLVFDEVDAGIGGETATAVGRALASLREGHQVIVVTHLAQVAAFADQQFVVAKVEGEGGMVTTIEQVSEERRLDELARMIGGRSESRPAIETARELVRLARSETI